MRVTIDHKTTRFAAKMKVEQRLSHLLAQFGGKVEELEQEWLGDTLRFRGKARGLHVEGSVEVTDDEVVIDGKLPLIAMPFESRIKQAVKQEADAMFRTA